MPETYEKDAAEFIANVLTDLDASKDLVEILDAADGTLAEWREANPTEAATADDLAEIIGFEIPNTDDYVWQAREALDLHLIDTAGYGYDAYKTIRVTLAGGGPSGWIEFTFDTDGGLTETVIGYCDWFQTPVTRTLSDAQGLAAYDRYRIELLGDL